MGKASKLRIDLPLLDSSKDNHVYFNNIHIQDLDNDISTINTTSSSSSSSSSSSALDEDSSSFSASSSLSTSSDMADMADDASSPLISGQSLYNLSDIMAQLPIKKGLSKYYDGKSQSYSSLSKVTSLEDLMKKNPHGRKPMKGSKSYGGCLDSFKSHTLPKPTISKRSSRNRLSSSSFPPKRGSLLNNCKPPLAPHLQNSLRC
ncbi:uncharacterized serine-rich protein C215.13-like [Impatiens glandulifera]|uniref:uncharacterized serine-rich protein C215.13-like n=1 Tax=Impatiens glandulifera TaxID=253017 RepID=UPI001FB1479A|nr:uncharacterized serine-rich protein C215.13-like [Impatiens glandulifera]